MPEADAKTLIRSKVPIKYDICRNVMLGILVTFVAVVVAIEGAQSFLPVNWHTAVCTLL